MKLLPFGAPNSDINTIAEEATATPRALPVVSLPTMSRRTAS